MKELPANGIETSDEEDQSDSDEVCSEDDEEMDDEMQVATIGEVCADESTKTKKTSYHRVTAWGDQRFCNRKRG